MIYFYTTICVCIVIILLHMLTFLFGDGVIQKGNFNLSFFRKFGLECCIVDDTNLEQFVPFYNKWTIFYRSFILYFSLKIELELKLISCKTE